MMQELRGAAAAAIASGAGIAVPVVAAVAVATDRVASISRARSIRTGPARPQLRHRKVPKARRRMAMPVPVVSGVVVVVVGVVVAARTVSLCRRMGVRRRMVRPTPRSITASP